MDELVKRLLDCRNDPGVIMADSRANLTRGKVKNATSIICLNPGSRRSRNRERSKMMGITDQESFAFVVHARSLSSRTKLESKRCYPPFCYRVVTHHGIPRAGGYLISLNYCPFSLRASGFVLDGA